MKNWLEDLTVVEIGISPAVQYCGRLFAQLCATVISASSAKNEQLTDTAHEYLSYGKTKADEFSKAGVSNALNGRSVNIVIGDTDSDYSIVESDDAATLV